MDRNTVFKGGRPAGARDKAPALPGRRTQALLNDVVRKAEAGDPVSLAVLAGAALLARSASPHEFRTEDGR